MHTPHYSLHPPQCATDAKSRTPQCLLAKTRGSKPHAHRYAPATLQRFYSHPPAPLTCLPLLHLLPAWAQYALQPLRYNSYQPSHRHALAWANTETQTHTRATPRLPQWQNANAHSQYLAPSTQQGLLPQWALHPHACVLLFLHRCQHTPRCGPGAQNTHRW